MSAYADILRIEAALRAHGVRTLAPAAEDHVKDTLAPDAFEQFKREVSFAHLRKIRDPRTFALLAVNVDRHGVPDYIGPNTFAEVAVAFAQRKRIYLFQGVPDVYADELSSWGAIALAGDYEPLIRDFQEFCFEESRQLSLLG